jgi:hypothetical protein
MSWPHAQEYNEAIQNPRICFHDADLKQGTVKNNAMGIPVAISGGFASVYQLTTPAGKWAIRCFIREITDSQRRYLEISEALNTLRLPYTVPFEFQQTGIRVGSRSYPIVKMQWIKGELLGDYVAKNVFNQKLIANLADKWAKLIIDLRTSKLAHGDLQHGNVVIVNDEIKLIDYDGMFVPSLKGMRSNEVGHPNFQHPRRNETDFGLYTDNFSAWIIYASLRILAISPEIYSFSRGLGRDECLIFSREDYLNPSTSAIFSDLRIHQNDTIVSLAQQITNFLVLAPKDVPHLDATAFSQNVIANLDTTGSEWWRDHIKEKSLIGKTTQSLTNIAVDFGSLRKVQREMIGAIVASSISFTANRAGYAGLSIYIIIQFAIIIIVERRLRHYFRLSPTGSARERHLQEFYFKDEEIKEKKTRLKQANVMISNFEQQEKKHAAEMQKSISELTAVQGAEIKKIYSDQALARAQLMIRKKGITIDEDRDMRAAIEQITLQLSNVQSQIDNLNSQKEDLHKETLKKERAAIMDRFLASNSISEAAISGIGTYYKSRLLYHGIANAADVTYAKVRKVSGIGYTRATTIVAWRETLELKYQRRLPDQISPILLLDIDNKFLASKAELDTKLESLQSALTNSRRRVTQIYEARRNQLANEEKVINEMDKSGVAAINIKYSEKIITLRSSFEQKKLNSRKVIHNTRDSINNLEDEIRRLQNWKREVGTPVKQIYDDAFTFPKYVYSVLSTLLKKNSDKENTSI